MGMCSKKQKTAPVPSIEGAPSMPVSGGGGAGAPQIVQDMVAASALGPSGYTDPMRANLHMDQRTAGQDATGKRPTSGMTGISSMPAWAPTPNAASLDPVDPNAVIARATPEQRTAAIAAAPGQAQAAAAAPAAAAKPKSAADAMLTMLQAGGRNNDIRNYARATGIPDNVAFPNRS